MVSAKHLVGTTGINIALVDHMTFCKINRNSLNNMDRLIASIKNATVGTKCVTAEFRNGKKVKVYYNGDYKKFNKYGKLASSGGVSTSKCIEKEHICLNIEGQKLSAERFVAICVDIVSGIMPDSYDGFNANVMDGSGSVSTASYLGIPVNLHPENIEWCFRTDNGTHGSMIRKLKNRTGRVYRFSAFDRNLIALLSKKDNENLIRYCEENLFRVK